LLTDKQRIRLEAVFQVEEEHVEVEATWVIS
jgi:hypothetical protein